MDQSEHPSIHGQKGKVRIACIESFLVWTSNIDTVDIAFVWRRRQIRAHKVFFWHLNGWFLLSFLISLNEHIFTQSNWNNAWQIPPLNLVFIHIWWAQFLLLGGRRGGAMRCAGSFETELSPKKVFGKVTQNLLGKWESGWGNAALCWGNEAICWGNEAICWGNEANLLGKWSKWMGKWSKICWGDAPKVKWNNPFCSSYIRKYWGWKLKNPLCW